MQKKILLLSFLYFSPILAQFLFGGCPEQPDMTDFDLSRFEGQWFETARAFDPTKIGAKCVASNVSEATNTSVVFYNTYQNAFFDIPTTEIVKANVDSQGSKFVIRNIFLGILPIESTIQVLDTDYSSYAVLYSCIGIIGFSEIFTWIWTRERRPSIDIVQTAKSKAAVFDIVSSWYLNTDQFNCFYPPLEEFSTQAST